VGFSQKQNQLCTLSFLDKNTVTPGMIMKIFPYPFDPRSGPIAASFALHRGRAILVDMRLKDLCGSGLYLSNSQGFSSSAREQSALSLCDYA
jgi:hypothetical protein